MKYLLILLILISNSVFALDYIILRSFTTEKLQEQVKNYLEKGYKLGGFGIGRNFYQVVYKD